MIELKDDDYVLTDGAAWLESAGFAIRIYTNGDGGLYVSVYESGDEMGTELQGFYIPPIKLAA